MNGKYRITDTKTDAVYIGTPYELEKQIEIPRRVYNWYSTQGLLYLLRFKIERLKADGTIEDYKR